ncbi:hypothetical protein C8R45DRAFT_938656 [Mycena sanguinolenta]|nr:hypothetical protein C8R45DRAFT_938656 [Mycena sanguinolenta]
MPRVLTLLRRSQSLPLPRRDAYPLSTAFGLTGTKAARYRSIQATITQALVTLAGPMPEGLPRDFSGHTLIRPRMNTGATRLKDAGEYFQRCRVHTNCCFAYYPLTDPLAREILEIDWIQELFDIRQELAPARRMQRAPRIQQNQVISISPEYHTRQWTLCLRKKLLLLLQRRMLFSSMAVDIEAVDIEYPIGVYAWSEDLEGPTELTLYPSFNAESKQRVLRLGDYRATFNNLGINEIQLYFHTRGEWIDFPWTCALNIYAAHQLVIARAKGVTHLEDWPRIVALRLQQHSSVYPRAAMTLMRTFARQLPKRRF